MSPSFACGSRQSRRAFARSSSTVMAGVSSM
jgi:hypothetical protein